MKSLNQHNTAEWANYPGTGVYTLSNWFAHFVMSRSRWCLDGVCHLSTYQLVSCVIDDSRLGSLRLWDGRCRMAQESRLPVAKSEFTFAHGGSQYLTIDFKSTAEFWLDNLFDDEYFKDGSLVVNPCNSPEQPPTSFGCAHYQQLIWELFNAVEKASTFVGETDQGFLSGTSPTVPQSVILH